jgi:hypothetical protein
VDRKLIQRSEPTPNTETETKVTQETTTATATTAEKGKAPVDKAAIEENANNLIAKGGKSMALKAWEEAVGYFGEALENMYVGHVIAFAIAHADMSGERSMTNLMLVWHLFYSATARLYSSLGSVNRE